MKQFFFIYVSFKQRLQIKFRRMYWSLLLQECGSGLMVYGRVVIKFPALVRMGHHCRLNEGVIFLGDAPMTIGNHVHISAQVILTTMGLDYRTADRPHFRAPIVIHDHVWLGAGSMVRPGVTIGEGAIVGMGSVVTHDVLPYTVVAGNPARKIKDINLRMSCHCDD